MEESKTNMYPQLVVKRNENPNRLYAFPFLGVIVKTIALIPVTIWQVIVSIGVLFYVIALPFYILFTGKYWDEAYNFICGYLRLQTKTSFFLYGITDKYPGFSLKENEAFTLTIEKPTNPSRWLAIPLFGAIIRSIILIPYYIWASILGYGTQVAVFASWFIVLFKKKYPESLHEFAVDSTRVNLATYIYSYYLSDKYPSFHIAMNHKNIKITLLVLGFLLMIVDISNKFNDMQESLEKTRTQIQNQTISPIPDNVAPTFDPYYEPNN